MTAQIFTFLDDIYGTLFTPQTTMEQLRNRSGILPGAIVVILVNLTEGLRNDFSLLGGQIITSLVTWFLASFLLERLAKTFGKSVALDRLLCLTGFASLPWIFLAPALNFGGSAGNVMTLAVIGWFVTWQVWAVSIALELEVGKVLALIPLSFAGGIVSIILLVNSIRMLLQIA